tara:strand:+ start:274 stop:906 length:633 start_codon:yes stop_codon:yes gene_type:complete
MGKYEEKQLKYKEKVVRSAKIVIAGFILGSIFWEILRYFDFLSEEGRLRVFSPAGLPFTIMLIMILFNIGVFVIYSFLFIYGLLKNMLTNYQNKVVTKHRDDRTREARERERAKDYDTAIRIWEEIDEINEAARVRTLKAEQSSVKVAQKVVHGDEVTKTEIKDSVLNRSNVGAGGEDKITKIKELKELHDAGAIDDDEFKQMKKEILGK